MESLHYLLMKAHSNVNRRILNEAGDLGLSLGQPKILECLMECGEINQKSIAAHGGQHSDADGAGRTGLPHPA